MSSVKSEVWLNRVVAGIIGACAVATGPAAVFGQNTPAVDTTRRAKTLFTWQDGALAGGFAVVTVAMFPIDKSIALRLQDSSTQANHFLKNASVDVQYLADPGAVIIGVSLYGIGRVGHWKEVADLGLQAGTEGACPRGRNYRRAQGRGGPRPSLRVGLTPDSFHFGRGFSNSAYQSFPSGHTTAAFAAASVVTSESQRWWPQGPGSWRPRCMAAPYSSAFRGCTTTITGRATSRWEPRSGRSRG